MKFNIELKKGVNPFYIGEPISGHLKVYPFNFIEYSEDEMWDEYDFFDDSIEVYVDKKTKLIESIACRQNCYLFDQNLIGLNIDEFFKLTLFSKAEIKSEKLELTDEDQQVYDIDEAGLQIWVNADDTIVTVFVSN
ncbi:hypothetical protein [Pinibacter aurantiacus]|uniref:Uncharacterized protein n=1 Tax=Pinibacter aurantiacus TaxID=2851599 RepID=A0A9E2SDK9_9BACT|nr:hypothetical protein [Pinibacter aurantiacus]MBV4359099.1 hypothetical protein [Pinibacter aurantiacus]